MGRTRAVTLGTKHELGTRMLSGSIHTNNTPHAHTQAGADATSLPATQPSHLLALWTTTLPSKSGAGSQWQPPHLGSLQTLTRSSIIWKGRRGHKPEAEDWSSMAPGMVLFVEQSLTGLLLTSCREPGHWEGSQQRAGDWEPFPSSRRNL